MHIYIYIAPYAVLLKLDLQHEKKNSNKAIYGTE